MSFFFMLLRLERCGLCVFTDVLENFVLRSRDGEGEDADAAYRERHKQAGDFLQEEKWSAQEGL